METKEQAIQLIAQYSEEILQMEANINVQKRILERNKEQKRIKRGGSRGRVSSDNFALLESLLDIDLRIARCESEIALNKNQVKLRKEEIKRLKKIK